MLDSLAPRTDIAFAKDDANRLLPWLLAFMIGLTTLLLALSIGLSSHMGAEHQRLQRTMHIELPAATEGYDALVKSLKQSQAVGEVIPIESDAMAAMLEPWIGDMPTEALGLPRIIEVRLAAGNTAEVQAALDTVKRLVGATTKDAEIQHFQEWLDNYEAYTTSIRMVASLLAALLLASVIGMVVLTARTSLHLHYDTVRILHRIGATDAYVSQQFVIYALGLVLKAALIGIFIGGAAFLTIYLMGEAWASPLLPGLAFSPVHVALVGLLPLFTVGVACMATSFTVRRLLEELY